MDKIENKPKRAFIRGLFGEIDFENSPVGRDLKLFKEKEDKFSFEYDTYVMGKDNFEKLKNIGIKNLKIISDNPLVFAKEYLFRNKIEIINEAMKEFDEIVWLDWDCNIVKELPDNFWEKMYEKESFQACLWSYVRPLCYWRKIEPRKTVNGGFVYIRERGVIEKTISSWEESGKSKSDEVAFSYMVDGFSGGWKGVNYYCENYEPMCCVLRGRGPCPEEIYNKKNVIFMHHFR